MNSRDLLWLVIVVLGLPGFALAADWNQWRGPNRNGLDANSPPLVEALPEEGLEPVWMTEEKLPGGGGWSSPVVADGKLYLFLHTESRRPDVELAEEKFPPLSEDERKARSQDEIESYETKRQAEQRERRKLLNEYHETLYCFSAEHGRLEWKNRRASVFTNYRQSGTPAVVDGRLFTIGADRTVRAVDVENGQDLWAVTLPQKPGEEPICSSPAVADGAVVVLAGQLFGLNAADGALLWAGDAERTKGLDSSPVVWRHGERELAIVNVASGETICVEPRTGQERWRIESHAGRSTPVVAEDRLITYGSSRKGGLRCFQLSPDSAEELWVFQGINDPGSSPVIVDGHVYVQGENRLACVDLATGKPTWRETLDIANPKYTSLVAGDGKVFYALGGVLCFAADPEEFRPLFQAKIDEAGRLAPVEYFRELLEIDELERTAEGQEKAQALWKQKIDNHGPVNAVSPALADGRLYLRLKSSIACYDLRRGQKEKQATVAGACKE